MQKSRVSLRLPETLIASLDASAATQRRARSNYVDLVLTLAASVRPQDITQLEADVDDKRSELVTVRVTERTWQHLRVVAARLARRSASELAARLLMGSTSPGWSERAAALPRRRGAPVFEDSNVFA